VFLRELEEFFKLINKSDQTMIIGIDEFLATLHRFKGTADLFGYHDLSHLIQLAEKDLNSQKASAEMIIFSQHQLSLADCIKSLLSGESK
jgi:HPt (histidine-containing phosphotransfer) domain-containing protein